MPLSPTQRPRPRQAQQRTERLYIRVTSEERRAVRDQADRTNLTESEYVRRRVLGKVVRSHSDDRVLRELQRTGGLLKYLVMEHPEHRDKINETMDVLMSTMRGAFKPREK